MDKLIIVALFVESIWETVKLIKKEKGINIDRLGAIIISIIVCIFARLDLFKAFDINLSIDYLGYIFTGILVSRGSNFLHDLLGSVDKMYQHQKNQ